MSVVVGWCGGQGQSGVRQGDNGRHTTRRGTHRGRRRGCTRNPPRPPCSRAPRAGATARPASRPACRPRAAAGCAPRGTAAARHGPPSSSSGAAPASPRPGASGCRCRSCSHSPCCRAPATHPLAPAATAHAHARRRRPPPQSLRCCCRCCLRLGGSCCCCSCWSPLLLLLLRSWRLLMRLRQEEALDHGRRHQEDQAARRRQRQHGTPPRPVPGRSCPAHLAATAADCGPSRSSQEHVREDRLALLWCVCAPSWCCLWCKAAAVSRRMEVVGSELPDRAHHEARRRPRTCVCQDETRRR